MKRSESERKAWRGRMDKLIKLVRDLPPEKRTELAQKSPIYTPEGHPLSGFNICLLMAQSPLPNLTICGGFRQWERAGAKVRMSRKASRSGLGSFPCSTFRRPRRQRLRHVEVSHA